MSDNNKTIRRPHSPIRKSTETGQTNQLESYEVVKKIGSGRFGEVFLIRHKESNNNYCWKVIPYKGLSFKEKEQIVSEVNVMRHLKHRNIVRYFDRIISKETQSLYIIMEYCDAGDLAKNISIAYKRFNGVHETVIIDIARQICSALAYCHSSTTGVNGQKVLHRDLKPQNIFLKKKQQNTNESSHPNQFVVKIGDFGLSKHLGILSFAHSCVGTPYYWSPELLTEGVKTYNDKSDIWALGCILYEMAVGRTPFAMARNFQQLKNQVLHIGPNLPIKGLSRALNNLIFELLRKAPENRPSAQQCLGYVIFQEIDEYQYINAIINEKRNNIRAKNNQRHSVSVNYNSENKIEPKQQINSQRPEAHSLKSPGSNTSHSIDIINNNSDKDNLSWEHGFEALSNIRSHSSSIICTDTQSINSNNKAIAEQSTSTHYLIRPTSPQTNKLPPRKSDSSIDLNIRMSDHKKNHTKLKQISNHIQGVRSNGLNFEIQLATNVMEPPKDMMPIPYYKDEISTANKSDFPRTYSTSRSNNTLNRRSSTEYFNKEMNYPSYPNNSGPVSINPYTPSNLKTNTSTTLLHPLQIPHKEYIHSSPICSYTPTVFTNAKKDHTTFTPLLNNESLEFKTNSGQNESRFYSCEPTGDNVSYFPDMQQSQVQILKRNAQYAPQNYRPHYNEISRPSTPPKKPRSQLLSENSIKVKPETSHPINQQQSSPLINRHLPQCTNVTNNSLLKTDFPTRFSYLDKYYQNLPFRKYNQSDFNRYQSPSTYNSDFYRTFISQKTPLRHMDNLVDGNYNGIYRSNHSSLYSINSSSDKSDFKFHVSSNRHVPG